MWNHRHRLQVPGISPLLSVPALGQLDAKLVAGGGAEGPGHQHELPGRQRRERNFSRPEEPFEPPEDSQVNLFLNGRHCDSSASSVCCNMTSPPPQPELLRPDGRLLRGARVRAGVKGERPRQAGPVSQQPSG